MVIMEMDKDSMTILTKVLPPYNRIIFGSSIIV